MDARLSAQAQDAPPQRTPDRSFSEHRAQGDPAAVGTVEHLAHGSAPRPPAHEDRLVTALLRGAPREHIERLERGPQWRRDLQQLRLEGATVGSSTWETRLGEIGD